MQLKPESTRKVAAEIQFQLNEPTYSGINMKNSIYLSFIYLCVWDIRKNSSILKTFLSYKKKL